MAVVATVALTGCKKETKSAAKPDKEEQKLIEEIGGCSDTYEGAVSTETYSSVDSAAEAFVNDEIVGSDKTVTINDVKKTEMTVADTAEVIPARFTTGALSVTKCDVNYSAVNNEESASVDGMINAALNAGNRKVTVYVIKFDDCYKYFTPTVPNGKAITKSYYDSIFHSDKYANCTLEQKTISESGFGGAKGGIILTQTMKIAENGMYITQTGETYASGNAEIAAALKSELDSQLAAMTFTDIYVEFLENDEYKVYVKKSNESNWSEGLITSAGVGSISDLRPFSQMKINYEYFTKTDYGCEISNDNMVDFYTKFFNAVLGNEMKIKKGYAKYYVSDGVLSGARISFTISIDASGMTVDATATTNTKCTDYGTTVVTKPAEIA